MSARWGLVRGVLGALAASVILAVIGAFSIWAQQSLLVPSLASAVLVQTLTPEDKSGRIWPTGIGQLAGLAGGLIGVVVAHAASAPIFMGGHPLVAARLVAAFVAVLVTGCLQCAFMAVSPAGGATSLIVALGMETPDWPGIVRLTMGIVLVTVLGEASQAPSFEIELMPPNEAWRRAAGTRLWRIDDLECVSLIRRPVPLVFRPLARVQG